jgi:uncharacterized membrane protein YccC
MSNLTLQSAVMRHAIRYGATSTVGVALVMSLHLVKGYWVLITIAVVLRPYAAITLQRTVSRCGGTMLGAVIAGGVLVATERSAALIVIMFVLAMLTFSLMSLNYGLGVVFLTPMVIVLISTGQSGDWGLAGHRLLDTLTGGGLALLGGYLLWPKVHRRQLVDELATVLEADRVHLGAVLEDSAHLSDAPDAASIRLLHEKGGCQWPTPRPPFSGFSVNRPGADPSRRRCGPSPLPPDGPTRPPVRWKVT